MVNDEHDRPRRLTRMLSFVLRHNPASIGVQVDHEGWSNFVAVVKGLQQRPAWTDTSLEEIQSLVESHCFTRFEIKDGQIRALYGHSLNHVSPGEFAKPPDLLFHATRAALFNVIQRTGIDPKSRRHAHLTSSWEYAKNVKADHERSGSPGIIFAVRTAIALKSAIPFYRASEVVWTAPYIPPSALVLVTTRTGQPDQLLPLSPTSEATLFSQRAMASFGDLLRDDNERE